MTTTEIITLVTCIVGLAAAVVGWLKAGGLLAVLLKVLRAIETAAAAEKYVLTVGGERVDVTPAARAMKKVIAHFTQGTALGKYLDKIIKKHVDPKE